MFYTDFWCTGCLLKSQFLKGISSFLYIYWDFGNQQVLQ